MACFKLKTEDLDIFGVPFMFTTNKKRVFTSFFSGVISILTLLSILGYAIVLFTELFQKLHPKIIFEYYSLKDYKIYNLTNDNFFFGFSFENDDDNYIDFKKYFTVSKEISYYAKRINETGWDYTHIRELETTSCPKFLKNISNKIQDIHCLNFSNNDFVGGDWYLSPFISYINIQVNLCNNILFSQCKSLDEIYSFLNARNLIYLNLISQNYEYNSNSNIQNNPL